MVIDSPEPVQNGDISVSGNYKNNTNCKVSSPPPSSLPPKSPPPETQNSIILDQIPDPPTTQLENFPSNQFQKKRTTPNLGIQ